MVLRGSLQDDFAQRADARILMGIAESPLLMSFQSFFVLKTESGSGDYTKQRKHSTINIKDVTLSPRVLGHRVRSQNRRQYRFGLIGHESVLRRRAWRVVRTLV